LGRRSNTCVFMKPGGNEGRLETRRKKCNQRPDREEIVYGENAEKGGGGGKEKEMGLAYTGGEG